MINNNLLQYLCCSKCKSDLINQNNLLVCKKCNEKYEIIDDNIIKIFDNQTPDLELSIEKWDAFYKNQLVSNNYYNEFNKYKKMYYEDTYSQINSEYEITKDTIYLEIGCGAMFFGQEIANKCKLVVGIDFCPSALKIAKKMLEEKGIKNYLLIQGDILNLPLSNNSVNLIYGGGTIEHFKDTQRCVDELYRVLKKGGVSFNTVPYLNLGNLIYRSLRGNIPNLPILKQIAEFIHIKLLKSKHMIFGYELSFLSTTLKRIHKKSGFNKIYIDKFEARLVFDLLPKFFKKPLSWLANNNRLFWPMIKVIGKK